MAITEKPGNRLGNHLAHPPDTGLSRRMVGTPAEKAVGDHFSLLSGIEKRLYDSNEKWPDTHHPILFLPAKPIISGTKNRTMAKKIISEADSGVIASGFLFLMLVR